MISSILVGFLIILGILIFVIACLHAIQWIEDEFDDILKTSFKKKELGKPKRGERVVKLRYEGCPAHQYNASSSQDDDDPFDWA